jgi:uncharacterized protein (TIGR03435 family)
MAKALVVTWGLALIATCSPGAAQTTKGFDVISIKPDKDGQGLDARRQPGGRYTARNASVRFLLIQAFGVPDSLILGGPNWLDDERYDIVAKADTPGALSPEELRPLLQSMLADRFRLTFHRETREFPAWSLTVGDKGAMFHPATDSVPNLSVSSGGGRADLTARRMPMSSLAKVLGETIGETVVDDTGLTGIFDFQLAWAPPDTAESQLPDIFAAVREQLGLRLVRVKKSPVEVIVIDRIDKASEN